MSGHDPRVTGAQVWNSGVWAELTFESVPSDEHLFCTSLLPLERRDHWIQHFIG